MENKDRRRVIQAIVALVIGLPLVCCSKRFLAYVRFNYFVNEASGNSIIGMMILLGYYAAALVALTMLIHALIPTVRSGEEIKREESFRKKLLGIKEQNEIHLDDRNRDR